MFGSGKSNEMKPMPDAAGIQPSRVPEPRQKKPRKKGGSSSREWVAFGSGFLSVLMILGLVAGAFVYNLRNNYVAPGPLAADTVVIIPRGQTREAMAENLRRAGIIADSQTFQWASSVFAVGSRTQAGEYRIPRGASMQQVVEIIASGRVVQHAITIPEGLTSLQIVQRLRNYDILGGEVRQLPTEGSLLPETYLVPRGYPRERLLDDMRQARERVLRTAWERRQQNIPVRTPEELLTLASIIEKETSKAEERTRVAGVFTNRLRRGMRLQSDPTIIYGIVQGQGTLGRAITRSDIDRPTAWNTYTIVGLPPTPIANPGRASIEAAANPMRTNELFFVADGTGGHTFSETYAQHQQAVARWREIERSRGNALPASADVGQDQPTQQRPQQQRRPAPQTQQQQTPQRGALAPSVPGQPATR